MNLKATFGLTTGKKGFALNELIVVIAACGIMIALGLPVIQHLREAARSQQCSARLTQIGLKSQVYEIVNERLPCQLGGNGAVNYSSEWLNSSSIHYYLTKSYISPLAMIANLDGLLRLDEELFDFDVYELSLGAPWDYPNFFSTAFQHRPEFVCPSEQNNQNNHIALLGKQPVDLGDPAVDDFIAYVSGNTTPGDSEYGLTNYLGVLGASTGGAQRSPSDLWRFRGMITSREVVRSSDVANSDGLSNTLMYGENIGSSVDGEIIFRSCWLSGAVSRGRGGADWMTQGLPEDPLLGRAFNSSEFGFGSAHASGITYVRGDASVQAVARDIDWQTYYDLCGAFDTD